MRKSRSHWSTRSQASFIERQQLTKQLERAELQARLCSEHITEESSAVERLANSATQNPQSHDSLYLGQHAERLQAAKTERRAYSMLMRRLRAQIRDLENPSAKSLKVRTAKQNRMARIAQDRLKIDKRIAEALHALRGLVEERFRLTVDLEAIGLAIELVPQKWEGVIDFLTGQLPDGAAFASESERWTNRFLGREQKLKKYVQLYEFTLPESLAHHHFYPGTADGTVYLTEEDAAALLARPNPPIEGEPQVTMQAESEPQRGSDSGAGWHFPPATPLTAQELYDLRKRKSA